MQVKFNPISATVGKRGYKINSSTFKIKLKKKGNKMFLKLTEIKFDPNKIVAEFGDDCYGVHHTETDYVGIYVKEGNKLFQISENLVKNPNKLYKGTVNVILSIQTQ